MPTVVMQVLVGALIISDLENDPDGMGTVACVPETMLELQFPEHSLLPTSRLVGPASQERSPISAVLSKSSSPCPREPLV